MRFTSLEVEHFQGVKAARVDFGPGLNVLYGPNDLGKSTLATAIRAALLVPVTSSEAAPFQPWHSDQRATVTLHFQDGTGLHWKVKKVFGGPAGAQLWWSKDGTDWTQEAKARQVDGKLRELLAWGIPSPGGKGGPRGFPQSFLSQALLGAQSEVGAILEASLAGDAADSGKLALGSALSALAQDPLLKKVLEVAQGEFDRFFTERGARKKGQNSALTLASEAVKQLQTERDALAQLVQDTVAIEAKAKSLRERRAELAIALEASVGQLSAGRARQAVAERLKAVEAELAAIDAHARRVNEATSALSALQQSATATQEQLVAARAQLGEAAVALRAAEDAARRAEDAQSDGQKQLERAQLEAKAAQLAGEQRRLDALLEKAAALAAARAAAVKASATLKQLGEALATTQAARTETEGEVQLANGIVAYGRWKAAQQLSQGATTARAEAAKHGSEALKKEVQAQQHDARALSLTEQAAGKQALLPTEAQLADFKRLAHDKAITEAALGGGVTVVVKPRRAVALNVTADDGAPTEHLAQKAERVIEADRRVELSIGDFVDIEVTAGAPEKRRALDAIKKRWREEVLPALEKAVAASVPDLEAALASTHQLQQQANDERANAKAARVEAEALRSKAAVLEAQAAGASKEELDAKEARIGALPRDLLEKFHATMGAGWEAQAEDLRAAKAKALELLQSRLADLEKKKAEAEWALQDAQKREAEAGPPAEVTAERAANAAALKQVETQLAALGKNDSTLLDAAKQAVARAKLSLQTRQAAVTEAEQLLAGAQAKLHAREGETKAQREQLEAFNRPAVMQRLEGVQRELSALGASQSPAERDVQQTQALFDEVKEELLKTEGALTKVAGPMAKDRLQQLDEAILRARIHERELLVDAESWKLLRDALREAENTESAHLGKALAVPVAKRFVELTKGRYQGVTLDSELKTEAVRLDGIQTAGDTVLNALSVGTKDQLATLVRLAVAQQLDTALVLDDQLVHTDPARLDWFSRLLEQHDGQVLVFTCRPLDYLDEAELATKTPVKDSGALRAVDLARVIT